MIAASLYFFIAVARPLPAILFGALVLSSGAAAQTIQFSALTGRVVDEAAILDAATRSELENKLAALEAKTSDQLVVVTLSSLGGRSIEEYGVALGRRWAIGQKDKNNGVLLIVAPNERKVRIEVGYGLEGVLTDAVSKLIIEGSILPRFRAKDFPGGIRRGVDDVISVLSGDAEEWKQRARPARTEFNWFTLVPFLLFGGVWGFILLSMLRHLGVWLGLFRKQRTGFWSAVYSSSSSSSGSSGWSGSSGGFSGGGGSFGGGGSSGSW